MTDRNDPRYVDEDDKRARNREYLINKLCKQLVDAVDLDTLCDFYLEAQLRYMNKEADDMELLEFLVDYEIITKEEADNIEQNGY